MRLTLGRDVKITADHVNRTIAVVLNGGMMRIEDGVDRIDSRKGSVLRADRANGPAIPDGLSKRGADRVPPTRLASIAAPKDKGRVAVNSSREPAARNRQALRVDMADQLVRANRLAVSISAAVLRVAASSANPVVRRRRHQAGSAAVQAQNPPIVANLAPALKVHG